MNKEEKQKTYESLIEDGYSPKEAKGVLQGMDDVENGRVFSAEEVYKFLLKSRRAYA